MLQLKYSIIISGIKVVAPASLSNLACGFDVLGMALNIPCDEMIGFVSTNPGIRITAITGEKKNIPLDPQKNIAGITATALLDHLQEKGKGIELKIKKHIPAGSGLGSSAASACAGAVLVNELLGRPFEKKDLIQFALQGELHASGTPVGDNVIASMLGGLVLVRNINTLDYHRIYTPKGLFVAVLLPEIIITTKQSRSILQPEVPLTDVIKQTANVGAFVIGMHQGDLDLISRSMEDHLIEKQRKHLIPHFDLVKEKAVQAGALACSISGAGPAIFALCHERSLADEVALAMQQVYDKQKLASKIFVGSINHEGTVLM